MTLGTHKGRNVALAVLSCMCVVGTALAFAAETFTVTTAFTPDKLGSPTNLSATAVFSSGAGVPVGVSRVLAYGPAGLGIDVAGAGACDKAKLEAQGTRGCPADSRIGFGGGIALQEIAKEIVKEPFTLDLFLGPRENGALTILVYVQGHRPAEIELVLVAKEVHGPKPYGFGVELEVPPIATVPGASFASAERAYFTVGSQHIAYYRPLHGGQRLVHVKGLIVPKACPRGGFPFEVTVTYLDGSQSTDTYTAPCPHA